MTESLTCQEESLSDSKVAAPDGKDRLAPSIQAIEDCYGSQLNADFQAVVATVRSQLEERLQVKFMQWDSERESLKAEIRDLHRNKERLEKDAMRWDSERESLKAQIEALPLSNKTDGLLQETTQTELALEKFSGELNRMINDPAVEISVLMRTKTKQAEMKAYLKGLQFQVKE